MGAEGLDVGTLTGRIELEDRLSNALEAVGGAIGKFEHSWKEAGSHVLETAASFFTAEAAMHAVEGAIHLGIETIKELTLEGAKVADIEENFNHLMDTSGRLGSTLLGVLREGTHSTISDMELMKSVNQDLAAGLNLTDAQFKTLSQGAFALAQATGQDVKTAFDTMNDAMLTGRTRALAMLTGTIDLVKAEEDYAKKIGVRVETLTEDEKIQAKREAILKAVGAATQRLGEQTDGLDEKVDQVKTTWANFEEELGKTIATSPVLLEGFDAIREELIAAFGGNSKSLVESIAQAIDNAAISVVDFAKYIVDGIGIAGMEWNAFKVVVETSAQGFRAITYVVEEVLLGLMKVANFVSGGSLFGGAIAATEKDIERLYNAMAEGENKISGYKAAEDEWAVSTGHVNEALERIKTRMEAAQKAHAEKALATADDSEKTKTLGVNTAATSDQVEKLGTNTRMTKEEQKAMAVAMTELASAGDGWKKTLETISGDTVEAVKYYLDAGVALDKLATAYGLTATQASAIEKSWKEGTEALKNQIKAAEELGDAWNQYYDELQDLVSTDLDKSNHASLKKYEDHVKMLQDLGIADAKYYDDAWKLYQNDVQKNEASLIAKDTKSKAYLQQQIRDAQATYDMMRTHSDQYTRQDIDNQGKIVNSLKDMERGWGQVNSVIDKQTEMVRTLSGEVLTLKEYEARQASGGSFNVNIGNLSQTATGMGINAAMAEAMARKGYSFQQIVEILRANPSINVASLPPGSGPRIPGFKDGGVGDFGDGTLVTLHGKEAIIPLEKAGAVGGNVSITQYINGTAAEVARKVSEEIMRTLKQQRQFGAA
jgi:hypothetical protein